MVPGLNPNLRYDVIGRLDGFNDVIMSNVAPRSPLSFASDQLAKAIVGQPFEYQLGISGGLPPVTITMDSGSLPDGVVLSGDRLTGEAPTGTTGTYVAEFTVSDAESAEASGAVAVELILRPLRLNNSTLPSSVRLGDEVAPTLFVAVDGEAPYSFSLTGDVPDGLVIDASTGELSGEPTETGDFSYAVVVSDARQASAQRDYQLKVWDVMELANTNLALGKSISSNQTITYYNGSSSPVNGNVNTNNYTAFGSGSGWLQVDLGAHYLINTIRLWFYWLDGRRYLDKKVEYSVDEVNWIAVYNDALDAPYNETAAGREFVFDSGEARYVRVSCNGNTVNAGNHIVELQVYLIGP